MRMKIQWRGVRYLFGLLIVLGVTMSPSGGPVGNETDMQGTAPSPAAAQPTDPDAGLIYGSGWMILFTHAPHGWLDDTSLANSLGVQEIFHPAVWDDDGMNPSILVATTNTEGGKIKLADEVERDYKAALKDDPRTQVTSGAGGTRTVPTRIFVTQRNWQLVVYRDAGPVIFLTTLRCATASQCAPLVARFWQFEGSLQYVPEVQASPPSRPQG